MAAFHFTALHYTSEVHFTAQLCNTLHRSIQSHIFAAYHRNSLHALCMILYVPWLLALGSLWYGVFLMVRGAKRKLWIEQILQGVGGAQGGKERLGGIGKNIKRVLKGLSISYPANFCIKNPIPVLNASQIPFPFKVLFPIPSGKNPSPSQKNRKIPVPFYPYGTLK